MDTYSTILSTVCPGTRLVHQGLFLFPWCMGMFWQMSWQTGGVPVVLLDVLEETKNMLDVISCLSTAAQAASKEIVQRTESSLELVEVSLAL